MPHGLEGSSHTLALASSRILGPVDLEKSLRISELCLPPKIHGVRHIEGRLCESCDQGEGVLVRNAEAVPCIFLRRQSAVGRKVHAGFLVEELHHDGLVAGAALVHDGDELCVERLVERNLLSRPRLAVGLSGANEVGLESLAVLELDQTVLPTFVRIAILRKNEEINVLRLFYRQDFRNDLGINLVSPADMNQTWEYSQIWPLRPCKIGGFP